MWLLLELFRFSTLIYLVSDTTSSGDGRNSSGLHLYFCRFRGPIDYAFNLTYQRRFTVIKECLSSLEDMNIYEIRKLTSKYIYLFIF